MPTKNPRVNITLDPQTMTILSEIALQEDKSLSLVAKELLAQALELREDMILSTIAESRDSKEVDTISHDEAWK